MMNTIVLFLIVFVLFCYRKREVFINIITFCDVVCGHNDVVTTTKQYPMKYDRGFASTSWEDDQPYMYAYLMFYVLTYCTCIHTPPPNFLKLTYRYNDGVCYLYSILYHTNSKIKFHIQVFIWGYVKT